MSSEDPARNTLFAYGMNIREVNADTQMTLAASSLIEWIYI